MSIKTLRKRISLVAITTLGAGVLAIVPVSSANADATVLAVQSTNVNNTAACTTGAPDVASTPAYYPVGGQVALSFSGTPLTTETISITGPAKFVTAGTAYSITGSDAKEVTLAAATVTSGAGPLVQFTGVGSVVIKLDSGITSTDSSLYFIVQASCSSAWSASKSKAQLNTTAGATATSSIDSSSASSRGYATGGQYGYLDIILKDAYDVVLSTTTTAKIATATGGCTVNWDATATTGTTTAVDPAEAGNATEDLVIIGDNTPRTCTVTVTFGDTVVASKTIKMLGEVASLTVDPANSGTVWAYGVDGTDDAAGTAANQNKIVYVAKDSAGNTINLDSEPSLSGATNGASQCTIAAGDYAISAITTNGYATKDLNCTSASVRGPATYKLAITRTSDAVAVVSNEIKVDVTKAKNTFKASWDKAVYNIGDIMTLTIEGIDDKGFKNYDGDTAGADVAVNVSGATRLSAAPATGDKFSKGVLKYQYSAGTTAAQYGWNALVSTVSGQDMVVGTYTIKDPNTGTTNADVLKSIVALIASINKQIQALQKLILKR